MSRRIGIYPGTFDPVHTGHIAFALQAMKEAGLDKVYFLPERRPRSKQHVEHFAHRVAMLKQATKPHPRFAVMELVDINFTVQRTFTRLKEMYPEDQLVFLLGSDVVGSIPYWPKAERLLKSSELVVGLRHFTSHRHMVNLINGFEARPKKCFLINSYAPNISSSKIREALRKRKPAAGILRSVERYSNRHWLYVSFAG